MEDEAASNNKSINALESFMDAKTVAYLLVPSIFFTFWACFAVYGTDYANEPEARYVIERQLKDAELRKIVAANIATGNPIPDRETMLKELDVRDERTKSWENTLVICGKEMRKIGLLILFGVAVQFYVVFKLRAHIKKLQREGLESGRSLGRG